MCTVAEYVVVCVGYVCNAAREPLYASSVYRNTSEKESIYGMLFEGSCLPYIESPIYMGPHRVQAWKSVRTAAADTSRWRAGCG